MNARKYKALQRNVSIANKRLKRLEDTGYDYYAYDVAKHYIDNNLSTKYYSTRGLSDSELVQLSKSVERFLSSKSSTVRGQRKIERERMKFFEKKKDLKGTYEEKKDFLRWLGDDGYKNLTEAIGYDKTALDTIIANYNKYKNLDLIDRVVDAYERNLQNYAGFIEDLRNGTIQGHKPRDDKQGNN